MPESVSESSCAAVWVDSATPGNPNEAARNVNSLDSTTPQYGRYVRGRVDFTACIMPPHYNPPTPSYPEVCQVSRGHGREDLVASGQNKAVTGEWGKRATR